MIIRSDKKSIKVIGYEQSSMTKDYVNFISKESKSDVSIVTPENFFDLDDHKKYQYIIGFCIDMEMRKKVCDIIDYYNLECISYIDNSSIILNNAEIGKGVFIGPFTTVEESIINNYIFIGCYCLIAHDVSLGRNTIINPGTLIAGKTTIGENCTFGLKSSAINKISITDNVNVGAFSNITKNITKPGRYVGTIARYVGE